MDHWGMKGHFQVNCNFVRCGRGWPTNLGNSVGLTKVEALGFLAGSPVYLGVAAKVQPAPHSSSTPSADLHVALFFLVGFSINHGKLQKRETSVMACNWIALFVPWYHWETEA